MLKRDLRKFDIVKDIKKEMVPKAGLEPARLTPLPPQDSVSTNSTTWARELNTFLEN